MKSSDEMRQSLQRLMGLGLEKPWSFGGSPNGADTTFHYWRFIWAELTERTPDFYRAVALCNNRKDGDPLVPDHWYQASTDPDAYKQVVSFWHALDERLGIEYPPASQS